MAPLGRSWPRRLYELLGWDATNRSQKEDGSPGKHKASRHRQGEMLYKQLTIPRLQRREARQCAASSLTALRFPRSALLAGSRPAATRLPSSRGWIWPQLEPWVRSQGNKSARITLNRCTGQMLTSVSVRLISVNTMHAATCK